MSRAALEKSKKDEAQRKFVPPPLDKYVEAGDPVEWFPSADPSAPPHVALVTLAGLNFTITANTFHPDLHDSIPMNGCRHIDDPKAREGFDNGGGGWRHKPLTVILRRLAIEQGWLAWDERTGRLVPGPSVAERVAAIQQREVPPEKPKV